MTKHKWLIVFFPFLLMFSGCKDLFHPEGPSTKNIEPEPSSGYYSISGSINTGVSYTSGTVYLLDRTAASYHELDGVSPLGSASITGHSYTFNNVYLSASRVYMCVELIDGNDRRVFIDSSPRNLSSASSSINLNTSGMRELQLENPNPNPNPGVYTISGSIITGGSMPSSGTVYLFGGTGTDAYELMSAAIRSTPIAGDSYTFSNITLNNPSVYMGVELTINNDGYSPVRVLFIDRSPRDLSSGASHYFTLDLSGMQPLQISQ